MQPKIYWKNLSLILISSLLIGCATSKELIYVPTGFPKTEPPKPLDLIDIKFEVVSYKNLNSYLENNANKYGQVVFIALDVPEYEKLAFNMAEFKRFINQQTAVIKYYEEQIDNIQQTNTESE
jgi:hypothetical protein